MATVAIGAPRNCQIGIKDKFVTDADILRFQQALNTLPANVLAVTSFSSKVSEGSGTVSLLTDVEVTTDCKYVPQVKAAITAGGFTIR